MVRSRKRTAWSGSIRTSISCPTKYNNPANIEAHYQGTGLEIWEQTGGQVDVFVAAIGTSGTLMGCSKRLKEHKPEVRIVGVEPYLGHKIQGLKNLREAYLRHFRSPAD